MEALSRVSLSYTGVYNLPISMHAGHRCIPAAAPQRTSSSMIRKQR